MSLEVCLTKIDSDTFVGSMVFYGEEHLIHATDWVQALDDVKIIVLRILKLKLE